MPVNLPQRLRALADRTGLDGFAEELRALASEMESLPITPPRHEFLTLAIWHGATLTGKPDGSEPITVVFTIDAWRRFDAANRPENSTPTQDTISIQEAWEAAGGNPGIKASKADLLEALRQLDKVCDEASEHITDEQILLAAEPFGEFQRGDAQGHARIAFARAILALRPAAQPAVPAGWKLVPVEPTPEMGEAYLAAAKIHAAYGRENVMRFSVGGYQAMLSAAPAAQPVALDLWCGTCQGTGQVYEEHQVRIPGAGGNRDCPDCDGKGYVRTNSYQLAAQPASAPAEHQMLFECVGCGHLYQKAPSQCDCMENFDNKYREWIAMPTVSAPSKTQAAPAAQPVGEPVAIGTLTVVVGQVSGLYLSDRGRSLPEGKHTLYTHAQPAHEPMTDEQIRSMCKQGWVFETVKQWVRVIEAHHKIGGAA